MSLSDTYTLYGSYASYYTAKVRAYLRKKSIPFVERLPSAPSFRETVRPASGTHRIPQLMTPEGTVLQDSVAIVDYLEARYPDLPAFPESPRQRTFVHLMELLGSEGLVQLAWQHRWMFTQNRRFVIQDFGRSFKPQGTDEALEKYGNLIADRMMSYGLPDSTETVRRALDEQYLQLLQGFEAHLMVHPYLLGGHPSAADYAVMGALHAHLGRDPAGLRLMQDNAPRTFRWVEHMQVPEVQSPEFYARPVEYPDDDQVPETAMNILSFIAGEYGQSLALGVLAFDQAMSALNAVSGHRLDPDHDQPKLAKQTVIYNGVAHDHAADLHGVWLAQRAQRFLQSQPPSVQRDVLDFFAQPVVETLLNAPFNFPIARVNNRLILE